jgi:hypothetical protein
VDKDPTGPEESSGREGFEEAAHAMKKLLGTDHRQLMDYDKKKYTAYDLALKKHWRMEKKQNEEDQKNLHRVIEIRPFLWT